MYNRNRYGGNNHGHEVNFTPQKKEPAWGKALSAGEKGREPREEEGRIGSTGSQRGSMEPTMDGYDRPGDMPYLPFGKDRAGPARGMVESYAREQSPDRKSSWEVERIGGYHQDALGGPPILPNGHEEHPGVNEYRGVYENRNGYSNDPYGHQEPARYGDLGVYPDHSPTYPSHPGDHGPMNPVYGRGHAPLPKPTRNPYALNYQGKAYPPARPSSYSESSYRATAYSEECQDRLIPSSRAPLPPPHTPLPPQSSDEYDPAYPVHLVNPGGRRAHPAPINGGYGPRSNERYPQDPQLTFRSHQYPTVHQRGFQEERRGPGNPHQYPSPTRRC
ncbi:hypothetical protein BJ684DRAFT_14946 [Piptocephalis cylindrospora]|uniref:Uncharacterized protein n=1 Tax=Piptocephalis cylindrospora TaxID=1907219 RepID=A0A4P9Y6P7_9FUNG|nr:hypothetical protein BJ684DRAFT_14946 [Piptocephalis cylindrospora]|eukprot:RKP14737.1 hypothetical protein BJ684DRAFT_14946 [Piptocephalis cylindrospora]